MTCLYSVGKLSASKCTYYFIRLFFQSPRALQCRAKRIVYILLLREFYNIKERCDLKQSFIHCKFGTRKINTLFPVLLHSSTTLILCKAERENASSLQCRRIF